MRKQTKAVEAPVEDSITPRMIEDRVSMPQSVTDCATLAEIQSLVARLIEQHGASCRIDFDSGHNNISEELIVFRKETPDEVNQRIDKEIEKLVKQEASVKNEISSIASRIESLKKAKS